MDNDKISSAELIKQCIQGKKEFYEVKDEIDIDTLSTSELYDLVDYLKGYYEPDIAALYVRNKQDNYDEIDYSKISANDKKDKFFMLSLVKGITNIDMPQFIKNIGDTVREDSSTKVAMAILNNNVFNCLNFSSDEYAKILSREPYVFEGLDSVQYASIINWQSPVIDWNNSGTVSRIVKIFGSEVIPQETIKNNMQNIIEQVGNENLVLETINKSVYSDSLSEEIQPDKHSIYQAIGSKDKYVRFLENELSAARADLKILEEQLKGGPEINERK